MQEARAGGDDNALLRALELFYAAKETYERELAEAEVRPNDPVVAIFYSRQASRVRRPKTLPSKSVLKQMQRKKWLPESGRRRWDSRRPSKLLLWSG